MQIIRYDITFSGLSSYFNIINLHIIDRYFICSSDVKTYVQFLDFEENGYWFDVDCDEIDKVRLGSFDWLIPKKSAVELKIFP